MSIQIQSDPIRDGERLGDGSRLPQLDGAAAALGGVQSGLQRIILGGGAALNEFKSIGDHLIGGLCGQSGIRELVGVCR